MWNNLGSKRAHACLIYSVTRIDEDALIGSERHEDFTVARFGRFCVCQTNGLGVATRNYKSGGYGLLFAWHIQCPLLYSEVDESKDSNCPTELDGRYERRNGRAIKRSTFERIGERFTFSQRHLRNLHWIRFPKQGLASC